MIADSVRDEFTHLLGVYVAGLKINGLKATGSVPWREDTNPSFSADLEKGAWYDHARQEGGGVKEFKARLGLNESEQSTRKIVAKYDYTDEAGNLLFQVVRFEPKDFRQRKPNGNGEWVYNLKDTRRVLYRLPDIIQADTVYICEGEKDCDKLWALGIPATTNAGGAGKWREEYSESLRNKRIVIIPDNDAIGEQHAHAVARSLLPIAASIKIVPLPGLSPKGDVSDWLDSGHTQEELTALVIATPPFKAEDLTPQPEAIEPAWPVLAEEALHGLVGEIVNTIDPYTEADPVATLLNTLAMFGNCLNAAPHIKVQHDRHPARLFVVQVGDTSKGRKGTGLSTPRYLFSLCDPDWTKERIKSGLSSGEGLIYNVRDPLNKKEAIKERGRIVDYQDVRVDEGVSDKRLLAIEPEFASVLTMANREGNILSAILRQSWDDGNLSPLTKNDPIIATNAHISIIGHVTKQELLARLDDTSKANGFANRFLWVLVKRSKYLPEGGAVPDSLLLPLADRLRSVIAFARTVTDVKRDGAAKELWAEIYHDLSEGKPGLLGAILSRGEAQVLRLSLLYALFDMSSIIRVEHLQAALALWKYCERSTVLIFGERLGDPTADRILESIRNAGNTGMSANDIYELFGKHKSANERTRAVNLLLSLKLIREDEPENTGGRPRKVYRAAC